MPDPVPKKPGSNLIKKKLRYDEVKVVKINKKKLNPDA